ncbi:MAG: glycosyltransferase family 2 protein [Chloracidobacterium sp.]|nr:glycosyltransferase family 2 protein [Chloracidobacterium sp.]
MANVHIEVVTPVHNRKELTLGCLRSLAKAELSGIDLHIIIVDDGSTDGTAESVQAQFPHVEILRGNGSLWYTGGMNLGLAAAMRHQPDFVLAINNDSEFDPAFLKNLLETAQSVTRSVVGAVLVDWEDGKRVFQVAPKWKLSWGGLRHWVKQTIDTLPQSAFRVELIVGNCALFPAEVIRQVGLMDADRFPQYGDAEYTSRMRKRGWTLLIEPRARVFCKPNDEPEHISELSFAAAFRALFIDPFHPHSLRRRLNTTVACAPSMFQGYLAFVVFFARYLVGRNFERQWGRNQSEPPLSETYAADVILPVR